MFATLDRELSLDRALCSLQLQHDFVRSFSLRGAIIIIYFVQLEKVLHRRLSFRHRSPLTVGALPSGQQKLTTFWTGIPPKNNYKAFRSHTYANYTLAYSFFFKPSI